MKEKQNRNDVHPQVLHVYSSSGSEVIGGVELVWTEEAKEALRTLASGDRTYVWWEAPATWFIGTRDTPLLGTATIVRIERVTSQVWFEIANATIQSEKLRLSDYLPDPEPEAINIINSIGPADLAQSVYLKEEKVDSTGPTEAVRPYGALTNWQRVIKDKYAGGEFDHLTFWQEEDTVGDGLFEFLMREFSAYEDCEDRQDAQRRMLTIMREVMEVMDAVLEVRSSD